MGPGDSVGCGRDARVPRVAAGMGQSGPRLSAALTGVVLGSAGRDRRAVGPTLAARIRPALAGERWKRPDRPAVLRPALLQRRRAQQLERAGHRVAERLRGEAHPAPRPFEQPAAPFDLRLQVLLPFAGGFELLGRDPLPLPVKVHGLDLPCEALRVPVADAAAKAAFDVAVDHPGEAAELAFDGLGLPHQHFQDVVLGALRKHEVVAPHLRRRLQLAVDAAVALFDAAGVPGEVEVEEVGAVRLEVQPLAGGVGGEQDAQRVARGVGVEAALDLPPPRPHGLSVDGLDTLLGEVGSGDGLFQHLAEVALRPDHVLREDQHPAAVPAGGGRPLHGSADVLVLVQHGAGRGAGRLPASGGGGGGWRDRLAVPRCGVAGVPGQRSEGRGRGWLLASRGGGAASGSAVPKGRAAAVTGPLAGARQPGAQVVTDPVDQAAGLGVRQPAGGGGHLLHPVEEGFLPAPDRLRFRVAGCIGLGSGVEGGDLRGLLRFTLVVGLPGAFVVGVRRAREQAGACDSAPRNRQPTGCFRLAGRRPHPLPLLPHRRPMPREGDGERLDGREQLLLQAHHEQGGGRPGARRPGLQPLLPQAAVLVEEAGEDELRRVLRQAVDDDAPHLPFREAALHLANVLLDAPHHHVFERAPSPDRHPPGEAVRVEQLQQGGEAVGVAVVGGRGEEQPVLEAPSEVADRAGELRLDAVAPAARRGRVVGLVEDQEAPRLHLAEPFAHGVRPGRVDEEVVRHEEAAVGAPRVDAEAPLLADLGEPGAVEDHEEEAEAFLHLGLPLLQDGRGRGDHDRPRLLAKEELARDEARFDGLAEARVVGDEEVDPGHPERLPQRLHLVGVDPDAGPKRGLEEARVGGGDAAPAQGVQEGAEVAGRVEAARADRAPRLLLQDAAVDLEVPPDLQGLPLGVVVGAREGDPRGGGRRGRLHRLHEPAPRAHLDELADARRAKGQRPGRRAHGWHRTPVRGPAALTRRSRPGRRAHGRDRTPVRGSARRSAHRFAWQCWHGSHATRLVESEARALSVGY